MKNICLSGRRLNALALAATLSLGLAAGEACAQQPPAAPSEEVVVTGTRIRAPNLTSDSPLATVSSDDIKLQGTVNISEVLNRLPQLTGDQGGSQATYGTPGTATLNLRDLGPARTLVLVDGNRLMPGDPLYPYPDVNFIPPGLVQSIDVVTGGASAVYGSDAVAGVVNFKMKHDFQGVQVEQDVSAAQHDNRDTAMQQALRNFGAAVPGNQFDGVTKNSSIIVGSDTGDGRGNVTGYFTRAETDPVTDASRDFAACGIATVNNLHTCSGSSNNAHGRFLLNGSGTGYSLDPKGTPDFIKYTSALAYDSQTDAYLQRQDLRYNAGIFAHYEISPAFDIYGDSMFMSDQTRVQISPSGVYSGHIYAINCDNPLLSKSEATTLCGANAGKAGTQWQGYVGYRFANADAPRYDDRRHTDYHEVLGTRGDLGGGWNYDVSGQYSLVDFNDTFNNDVSIRKAQNSLLVKNVNGVPTCTSAINGTDPSCVPLNIFQTGPTSAAALNYVFEPAYEKGQVTEKVVSGSINGDLGGLGIQSPLASNPVAVAFGSEYRVDAISLNYSQALLTGDLASTASSPIHPTNGSIDVYDIFGEARVPLIEDKAWVKALSFDTGYRLSEYNLAGQTNTYKFGLNYAPTADINFRTGFNRAVRAPNVVELFSPDAVTSASGADACAGASPTASLAQCEHSGVTPAQYGTIAACSSGFCNALTGGNTALKPERANTYTIGAVFTPTLLKSFTGSIDYYNINVKDVIGTIPTSLILSSCLATGNPFYCGLIHRNSVGTLQGQGGFVTDTNLNLGYQHTAGIDFGANYRFDFDQIPALNDAGSVLFGFNGTWEQTRRIDPAPGQASYDCKGLYGPTCGVPSPMWRHTLRTTWDTPWDALVSFNWRYIGGTKLDFNTNDPTLKAAGKGATDFIDGRIPSYSYFDLTMSKVLYSHYTLRLGVNNIFDKSPPLVDTLTYPVASTLSNANTYPGTYDTLGRVLFLNVTATF